MATRSACHIRTAAAAGVDRGRGACADCNAPAVPSEAGSCAQATVTARFAGSSSSPPAARAATGTIRSGLASNATGHRLTHTTLTSDASGHRLARTTLTSGPAPTFLAIHDAVLVGVGVGCAAATGARRRLVRVTRALIERYGQRVTTQLGRIEAVHEQIVGARIQH